MPARRERVGPQTIANLEPGDKLRLGTFAAPPLRKPLFCRRHLVDLAPRATTGRPPRPPPLPKGWSADRAVRNVGPTRAVQQLGGPRDLEVPTMVASRCYQDSSVLPADTYKRGCGALHRIKKTCRLTEGERARLRGVYRGTAGQSPGRRETRQVHAQSNGSIADPLT